MVAVNGDVPVEGDAGLHGLRGAKGGPNIYGGKAARGVSGAPVLGTLMS